MPDVVDSSKPDNRLRNVIILFIVLLVPSLAYMWLTTGKNQYKRLAIYGEKEVSAKGDTLYHVLPSFSFTNQEGKTVTDKDYEDKIMVADFMFTTCKTICPEMTTQLVRVQNKFRAQRDIKLVSFTVNPDFDTPDVLHKYAQSYMASNMKWNFLTGPKKDIYELAIKGFLVPAQEDALAEGGFLHSEMVLLIDKEKRVRGFYDGTSKEAIDTLMDEIIVLMQEYKK